MSAMRVRASSTLLAAALLTDAILSIPEPLSDLLALVCLVAAVLVGSVSGRAGRDRWKTTLVTAAVLLAAGIALRALTGPVEVLVLLLVVYGARWLDGPRTPASDHGSALEIALLVYSIYLVAHAYVPIVDRIEGVSATALSGLVSGISQAEVSLGASMIGFRLFVLLVCYILGAALVAPGRATFLAAARALGVSLVSIVAYGYSWSLIAESVSPDTPGIIEPFVKMYDYRVLLVLPLLAVVLVMRRALAQPGVEAEGPAKRRMLVIAAALVVGVAALGVVVDAPVTEADKGVLIVDTGDIEHDLPDFDAFGLEAAGRFGLLPVYLEARDYDVRVVEELEVDDLDGTGTLVLINILERLSPEVEEAIWEFVERGGSLLVAGDHTGIDVIREPSNHLLERAGISLRFDSAIPAQEGWVNGVEMRPHPVLYGIEPEEIQVLIGASLQVAPPASAVLVGRDGFSDEGDAENITGGYLGDMRFIPGEQLGDVCLIAQAPYGRGKVLVFGDTTTFQNPSLPRSYRFVDGVFEWLSAKAGTSSWAGVRLVAMLVLLLGLIFVVWLRRTDPYAIVVSAAVLALVLAATGLVYSLPASAGSYDGPHAVVDVSHFGLGSIQKTPEALDGLTVNLLRNGYTPFLMRDFDSALFDEASILVVPSPLAPFSDAELDALEVYVEGGGLLVVTAGYERQAGAQGLLARFGMALGAAPLGQGTGRLGPETVHFWSAWPMECAAADVEVVAEVWDYAVILYRARGEGGVLAVGDGSFLFNKNLEDATAYNEHNIYFLKALLNALVGRGSGDA